ncbi:MAG TPA: hypothetical protein VJP77_08065, partial [Planctomycetota bacterium]|nr:hypothetical protein [Planctomycetota bacterium]
MPRPSSTDGADRRLARGVAWNLASLGILGVSGFALLALVERVYDAEALGLFQQVWGAYVLLSQAAVGGLDRSVLQRVAGHARDRRETAAIAL